MVAPEKNRYVLHHVWKTGGTELCRLARANAWHVPKSPGCSLTVLDGWPVEDYDLIGHEAVLYDGPKVDYIPKTSKTEITVHNVQWITMLRHPYSRSLSHFYHNYYNYMLKNITKTLTMEEFFQGHGGSGFFVPEFDTFIRDQQTRWHCGFDCSIIPKLRHEHLRKAMDVLNKFNVVLILEDMNNPDSCTRRQMKYVLNFTKVEVLNDSILAKLKNKTNATITRRPGTRWDDQVAPFLTSQGRHSNNSIWGSGVEVMAELSIHNEIDLQFYGYAQQRCEELAARIQTTNSNNNVVAEQRTNNNAVPALLLGRLSCMPKYYPWFLSVISLVICLQLRVLRRLRNRIRGKEN